MSTAIQKAIAELETELAALDDKRADLEKAIVVLQRLQGEGVTASSNRRRPKARRVVKRNGAVGRVKAAPSNEGDAGDQILSALKNRSPLSPADIEKATGLSRYTLVKAVKALAKQKRVEILGKTSGRRIGLPGKTPARGHL